MAFGKKTAILSAMGSSEAMESESMAGPQKPKRNKNKVNMPNPNFKVKCHKRNC
jgi:hypothetical protein